MERKSWTVDVDGTQHVVVLNWSYYGGERQVAVDGQVVDDSAAPMRWRSEQSFALGGRQAVVRTQPAKRMSPYFRITLELDGTELPPDAGRVARWERA